MFWIVLGLFLIAAILLLANPFYRPTSSDHNAQMKTLTLALQNVETDLAAGTLSPSEADTLRRSTAKRILELRETHKSAETLSKADRTIFGALGVFVVISALGLYWLVGTPASLLPQPTAPQTMEQAVTQLTNHLRTNPDDANSWQLLGWTYYQMQRYAEAKTAYETALQLAPQHSPQHVETLSSYGETLVMLAEGQVTPAALQQFTSALQSQPNEPRAQFYAGLAKQQAGAGHEALAIWQELLQSAPSDAEWRPNLLAQIGRLSEQRGTPLPATPPGPTAADIQAAEQMAPEQRQQMIETMVENLANKLAQTPNDLSGWQRLIRAYQVMNQPQNAPQALTSARIAFAEQPLTLAEINAFAIREGIVP